MVTSTKSTANKAAKPKSTAKKKTPAKRTDPTAAAWAALGYVAGKEGKRDSLADGSETAVSLKITGTVGAAKIKEAIKGTLSVGIQQTGSSTSGVDQSALLGFVLGQLSKKKRGEVIEQLAAHYKKEKALPEVSDELKGEAAQLLSRLRTTKATSKRGAVTFEHAT